MFGAEAGLYEEFGFERIRYTPISELGLRACHRCVTIRMRPVVEYGAASFMYVAADQMISVAGASDTQPGRCMRASYLPGYEHGGGGAGPQHSDNICSLLFTIRIQSSVSSTPYDAKGLLKSAIRDDNQ